MSASVRIRISPISRASGRRSPTSSISAATISCCTSLQGAVRPCTDRVSYLALLTGRSPPLLPANAGAEEVVRAIADAPRAAEPAEMETIIRGFGVPLSPADYATIRRLSRRVHPARAGTAVQQSRPAAAVALPDTSRPDRRDRSRRPVLALPRRRDRLPVRSAAAGARPDRPGGRRRQRSALRCARSGGRSRRTGERVSAFYISNVESYLYRDGAYGRFLANLNVLRRATRGVS